MLNASGLHLAYYLLTLDFRCCQDDYGLSTRLQRNRKVFLKECNKTLDQFSITECATMPSVDIKRVFFPRILLNVK